MKKKAFKAESKRLLDLMINSIYTHKEIFLREIISNASDAIDKLCYLSLTDDKVGLTRDQFEIKLSIDKERRLLTVSDNGIGMSQEELENNLGVIASSGSLKFRQEVEGDESADTDIIGQFGVGFYTIEPCEKDTVGTDIIMHIKPDTEEEKDEYSQYLREYPLYKLVKKYSDYIRFPIRMLMPHPELKEGSTQENPEYEEKFEWETLNSMVPLWQRKKADVKKEEYDEFYQQRFADSQPPLSVITVSAEGAVTYKALLFIPEKAPLRYYSEEFEGGLQLYSAGVMIMDKCKELLPECFNFVRGVVESPDLNLNISRELLQHDRQVEEPFGESQIGSSAMAYKRNPMRCERICSLSRYLMADAANAPMTAAVQWMERTLDDSANRRISLPEGFLCADAVLRLCQNVTKGLHVNEAIVDRTLREYLPFLATEDLMMEAVKRGGDRQQLHEIIRRHSMAATALRPDAAGAGRTDGAEAVHWPLSPAGGAVSGSVCAAAAAGPRRRRRYYGVMIG